MNPHHLMTSTTWVLPSVILYNCKTQICRHSKTDRHAVMSCCYSLHVCLCGKHGRPQGRAVFFLNSNPLVWSDGHCRDCKCVLPATCMSTAQLSDPAHFDEFWFFLLNPNLLLIFFCSGVKCAFKVDYRDYLET